MLAVSRPCQPEMVMKLPAACVLSGPDGGKFIILQGNQHCASVRIVACIENEIKTEVLRRLSHMRRAAWRSLHVKYGNARKCSTL
jgi:hypothetical protein